MNNRRSFITGVKSFTLSIHEKNFLMKFKPWGVILFSRNIKSIPQTKKLTNEIRKIFKDVNYPILIDQEGGRVSRLRYFLNTHSLTSEYFGDLYNIDKKIGLSIYKSYIKSVSNYLRNFGININTSPVLDLFEKKSHKIIGNRSYSENPITVNMLGRSCIKFYKNNKISTVIKHIPGHGKANVDSHFKLPIIKDNLRSLTRKDFKCFKNIKSHSAMTAHILYEKIDRKNNATHSKILIKKIIRKQIGFKGILISDDISMKALKYNIVKNARLALEAGCNLILYCAGITHEVKKILKETPYIDAFTKKKTSEFYKFLS